MTRLQRRSSPYTRVQGKPDVQTISRVRINQQQEFTLPISPELQAQIAARHEEVVGKPPRIPPVDRTQAAEEVQATTKRLLSSIAGPDRALPAIPVDAIPEIMFTMCRVPELWQSLMDVTVQLQGPNSKLDSRDRKLAILRTGWLCQAPYEFGEHVEQARRLGFSELEVDQVVDGSTAPEWNDHERAILQAVEELHESSMVSDETWAVLSTKMTDDQLLELLVLVGQFTATAYFQNSLRLRLENCNKGLSAR
jgi:4-carboxymuconolactone decarboxylase